MSQDYIGNIIGFRIELHVNELKLENSSFMDIIELEHERLAWSIETFTEATPISSLKKLRTEIDEIEYDIQNGERRPEEYADALMCLFDSAGRLGIDVTEIIEAFHKKLAINKQRKWIKNPDNSYSHIK